MADEESTTPPTNDPLKDLATILRSWKTISVIIAAAVGVTSGSTYLTNAATNGQQQSVIKADVDATIAETDDPVIRLLKETRDDVRKTRRDVEVIKVKQGEQADDISELKHDVSSSKRDLRRIKTDYFPEAPP